MTETYSTRMKYRRRRQLVSQRDVGFKLTKNAIWFDGKLFRIGKFDQAEITRVAGLKDTRISGPCFTIIALNKCIIVRGQSSYNLLNGIEPLLTLPAH